MMQQQLWTNTDGSVSNWEYNPEVARENLCRLIAFEDLLLGFGESPAFEEYIKTSHNPRFTHVSRQTTTRDFKKLYNKDRLKLKENFKTCTFSVSLTSDIWAGRAKEDYLSVVAHYINPNWEMEKRIIGLTLIESSHTGENIAKCISKVIEEFELSEKIFSITLDNASANTSAMNVLKPLLSTYAPSFLMHQRCACHIINLIVKSGLKRLKPYLQTIREAISFLNSSNVRIAAWKNYCRAAGE